MVIAGRLALVAFGVVLGGLIVDITKTEKEIKELQRQNDNLDDLLKRIKRINDMI